MRHLSVYELDELYLGVFDDEKARAAELHLQSCLACRGQADRSAMARQQFSMSMANRPVRVAARPRERVLALSIPLFAASFAALLVLWIAPAELENQQETVGIKGSPNISTVVRRDGHMFTLDAAGEVEPGDQLRFIIQGSEHAYLMAVSADAGGHATVYVPFDGVTSYRLPTGTRAELPGSVVLDEVLGPERIFFLLSDAPLAARDVIPVVRSLAQAGEGAIEASRHLEVDVAFQTSILLHKVRR